MKQTHIRLIGPATRFLHDLDLWTIEVTAIGEPRGPVFDPTGQYLLPAEPTTTTIKIDVPFHELDDLVSEWATIRGARLR